MNRLMMANDELGLVVVWNGSCTFNVYEWSPALLAVDGAFKGGQVDVFSVDNDGPLSMGEAAAEMQTWLVAQREDD